MQETNDNNLLQCKCPTFNISRAPNTELVLNINFTQKCNDR